MMRVERRGKRIVRKLRRGEYSEIKWDSGMIDVLSC
jgi:hypothetical protein